MPFNENSADSNNGESFVSPAQWEQVRRALRLTPRQMQIVKLIFAAQKSYQMARTLGLKRSNIDKHLRRLYRRTSTQDRGELMLRIFKIILTGKEHHK